jgi:hypothetical protein
LQSFETEVLIQEDDLAGLAAADAGEQHPQWNSIFAATRRAIVQHVTAGLPVAESHLTPRSFAGMLSKIAMLPSPAG